MKTNIDFLSYSAYFFWEREMFWTENRNTRFVLNNFLSRKLSRLWDNAEKYCRSEQTTYDNMAHANCNVGA